MNYFICCLQRKTNDVIDSWGYEDPEYVDLKKAPVEFTAKIWVLNQASIWALLHDNPFHEVYGVDLMHYRCVASEEFHGQSYDVDLTDLDPDKEFHNFLSQNKII